MPAYAGNDMRPVLPPFGTSSLRSRRILTSFGPGIVLEARLRHDVAAYKRRAAVTALSLSM